MSNFSFSHNVFYPYGELFAIFIKFEIVVCKLFESGRVQILSFGKGLTGHIFHFSMMLLVMFELFTKQSQLITTLKKKVFENILEKGEHAGNQHFLLFQNAFYLSKTNFNFQLFTKGQCLCITERQIKCW